MPAQEFPRKQIDIFVSFGPGGAPTSLAVSPMRAGGRFTTRLARPKVKWLPFDARVRIAKVNKLSLAEISVNREVSYNVPQPAVPLEKLQLLPGWITANPTERKCSLKWFCDNVRWPSSVLMPAFFAWPAEQLTSLALPSENGDRPAEQFRLVRPVVVSHSALRIAEWPTFTPPRWRVRVDTTQAAFLGDFYQGRYTL